MSGQFNVYRKAFHFSGIIFLIVYYADIFRNFPGDYFVENTRSVLFYALMAGSALMYILEILRFRFNIIQKWFILLAGKLMKPSEEQKIHGSIPLFLGVGLSIGFFMQEIAIICSLFLMVGDPCAAWFGGKMGKHRLKNGKSFEGFIAGILGAFFSGFLFLIINTYLKPESPFSIFFQTNPFLLLFVIFIGATIAFTVELFSSSSLLDDNFLLPAVSGLGLSFCIMIAFHPDSNLLFFSVKDLFLPK